MKGRFAIHRITPEEASYKLLKVRRVALGARGVPYITTHDGRTIRYPDPAIKVNDTVKFDIEQNKLTDFIHFETGNVAMITGGRNMGRAGVIVHRERHIGGFDIVHVRDVLDRTFATRSVETYLFPFKLVCFGFLESHGFFFGVIQVEQRVRYWARVKAVDQPPERQGHQAHHC